MRITTNNYNIIKKKTNNSFKANVHIVDGFLHADTMEHFAKAVLKNTKNINFLKMHYVECNSIDINTKQMNSVEEKLKELNSFDLNSNDFVAIPGLASVPILNLKDRIKDVLNLSINLTSQNLKIYKNILLNLLKEFYSYKYFYSTQISKFDKNNQNLEYTYGVIQEINKLVAKGVNVYIPAGHGADSTLKWFFKSKGENNELVRYIATNSDYNGIVKKILNEANDKNYYDFNLLSLSDAHVVNVKNLKNEDFIFSAKDGYSNDGERGLYNFTPIRDINRNLLGYSFTDTSNVEYPYNSFKANNRIANLCRYVGLPLADFWPTRKEIDQFEECIRKGKPTYNCPDKLFPISQVFSSEEIEQKKLDRLGFFINREQNLLFEMDEHQKILFRKTNCEGTDKPSVMQMWGSCFATINALKRDIEKSNLQNIRNISPTSYIKWADYDFAQKEYLGAEYYLNKALDILHPNRSILVKNKEVIKIYENLFKILKKQNKDSEAKHIVNILIDLKAYSVKDLSIYHEEYLQAKREISNYYEYLAKICKKEGEDFPSKVCNWAKLSLDYETPSGYMIMDRRATGNQYIGDLYNEYH